MASSYEIFLDSKYVEKTRRENSFDIMPHLKNVVYAFGSQSMDTFEDVNDFGKRSLTGYEDLRKRWNLYRSFPDKGRNAITRLIQGFAATMRNVLDLIVCNVFVKYSIAMSAKTVHETG